MIRVKKPSLACCPIFIFVAYPYLNYEPLNFEKSLSIFEITTKLNNTLEKMILKNTDQWIWSHDRWK